MKASLVPQYMFGGRNSLFGLVKHSKTHTKAMTLFKENGDEAAADEMRALFARVGWGVLDFKGGKKIRQVGEFGSGYCLRYWDYEARFFMK